MLTIAMSTMIIICASSSTDRAHRLRGSSACDAGSASASERALGALIAPCIIESNRSAITPRRRGSS
jgi:hypothetical protein